MNDYELVKQYQDGMGGPNKDSVKISYSVDNVNYSFQILYGNVITIDTLDTELLNILNNNNYKIVNEELKDMPNLGSYGNFRKKREHTLVFVSYKNNL